MGDVHRRGLPAANHLCLLSAAVLVFATPLAAIAQEHSGGPREPTTAGTEPAPARRFDLALFDGVTLSESMLERICGEVEAVFSGLGVEIGWVDRLKEPMRAPENVEILVILLDVPPANWGLEERVMGTVPGKHLPLPTVYVFYPSVLQTIKRYGYKPGPRPRTLILGRESRSVARALARVVAHEVIHVLTPGREHPASGLMQARLDQHELLADAVLVDADFVEAFQRGLTAAIHAQQVLVANPENGDPVRKK